MIELPHRKVPFTAYGFFSLDCTLLHSLRKHLASLQTASTLQTFCVVDIWNDCNIPIKVFQFKPEDIPVH